LAEVVESAESAEDLGGNLADFLDHINLLVKQRATRQKLFSSIGREPPRTGEAVQDAYLAAVAAHLANTLRLPSPRWVDKKSRRLRRPWFALPDAWARAWLLRDSPAAFRERNLFTDESALRRV
jgi:hypothetical protein